jgi:YidC/Oxa1 family membrane protein insertase
MEKRFFLALALSFLVLMFYSSLLPKTKPIVQQNVTSNVTAVLPEAVSSKAQPVLAKEPTFDSHNLLNENNLQKIESDGMVLTFSKKGGFILDAFDKAHNSAIAIKNIGLVKEWTDYSFEASEIPHGIVFDYRTEDGSGIKKTFRVKSGNIVELTLDFYNLTYSKINSYSIYAGFVNPSDIKDPVGQRYYESSVLVGNVVMRKPVHSIKNEVVYEGKIVWAGLRDRYFCSLILPQLNVNKSVVEKQGSDTALLLNIPERSLSGENAARFEDQFNIYIGPQDERALKMVGEDAEKIVNYGTFDVISKALLFLLSVTHSVTKNWGWSIIIVTILVYLLLFPLSLKSMLSMRKMQTIQPKVEELRRKLKDNPQKLNIEIMELYKREKINPFGGCLPMLLQIPVFFALYQALMRFISLRGASFLWIKDLAGPDRAFVFKNSLPLIGNELNILPLLMAISMFLQQKFSMTSQGATSEVAEQQKIMTIMMPVIFGALFYKMMSGLVLYWFVNSLLMFAFQWKISKTKQSN